MMRAFPAIHPHAAYLIICGLLKENPMCTMQV